MKTNCLPHCFSSPPLNETLQQYIDAGLVEYHYIMRVDHWTRRANMQVRNLLVRV
jgi:hypothetical protein